MLILGYAFSDFFSNRINNSESKNNSITNYNDKEADVYSNNNSVLSGSKNSNLENLITQILDKYVVEATDHKSKIYSQNSSSNIEYDGASINSKKSNSNKSYKSNKSIGSTYFKTKNNEYVKEMEKKIGDLEDLVENLRGKINDLENENLFFQSKIKDLENELEDNYKLISKKDSFQSDIIKENENLSDLKLLITRKNEEIRILQMSIEHKTSNHEKELVMLKEKISSQNEQITNLQLESSENKKLKLKLKEYSSLEEKLKIMSSPSNIDNENKTLKNKIQILEKEMEDLSTKCKILNELNIELTKKSIDEEMRNKKNLKVIIDTDLNNISDILAYKDMKTLSKDNSPNSVILNNIMTPYVNNDLNSKKFNFDNNNTNQNIKINDYSDNNYKTESKSKTKYELINGYNTISIDNPIEIKNINENEYEKYNISSKEMNKNDYLKNEVNNSEELNMLSLLIHTVTEENMLLNKKFREMSENFDNLCNSYNKLSLMYMNSTADKGIFSGIFKKNNKESKEMVWLEKEKNKFKEFLDDFY